MKSTLLPLVVTARRGYRWCTQPIACGLLVWCSGALQTCCFAVNVYDTVMVMWADSASERADWMRCIRTAQVVKAGYLLKHSAEKGVLPRAGKWHRRWVVLYRRSIGFFRREDVRISAFLLPLQSSLRSVSGCAHR